MKRLNGKHLGLGVALAATALLAVPTGAGGHATVSPSQPQTTPLTAARTSYVVRVPEREGRAEHLQGHAVRARGAPGGDQRQAAGRLVGAA